MDELVIGEQKYISSKRAAELTGYAKDYIGQLCREGRVEARLVGRSWYVREAAIKDHRFGVENSPESDSLAAPVVDTGREWTSPRYQAEVVEELPTHEEMSQEPVDTAQQMQEAWQEWFSKNRAAESPVSIDIERIPDAAISPEQEIPPELEVQVEEEVQITRVEESEPVAVAIERVETKVIERPVAAVAEKRTAPARSYTVLRATLLAVAIVAVAISAVGTGFLGLPRDGLTASVSKFITGTRVIAE